MLRKNGTKKNISFSVTKKLNRKLVFGHLKLFAKPQKRTLCDPKYRKINRKLSRSTSARSLRQKNSTVQLSKQTNWVISDYKKGQHPSPKLKLVENYVHRNLCKTIWQKLKFLSMLMDLPALSGYIYHVGGWRNEQKHFPNEFHTHYISWWTQGLLI